MQVLRIALFYSCQVRCSNPLENLHCDEELVAAGLLYDIIEDTDTTYDQVEQKFGKRVADIVLGVTSDGDNMKAAGGKRLYLAKKWLKCLITL